VTEDNEKYNNGIGKKKTLFSAEYVRRHKNILYYYLGTYA
jgi:hypothetical protein